ncbi:MAG: hypothetical protein K2H60_05960 [Muribaculaceae bacterium]|nr:hypothetical protein [Muribaculaceae bacterium]
MRNSTLWGIALAAVIGSGAVAATSLAPAYSTVTRDAEAVSYTLTPAPGDLEIKSLQNITLTFPDIKGVAVNENVTNAIVLKNNTTGTEYVCYAPDLQSRAEGGTQYLLVFSEEMPSFPEEPGEEAVLPTITEAGAYTLTIKKGAFVYGEEVDENGDVTVPNSIETPEIVANYSIGEAIAYAIDPVSGAEVTDLSKIQINFPTIAKDVECEFMPNYENSILLINESTGTEYKLAGDPIRNTRSMLEGVTYEMYFVKEGDENVKAINEPGKYTLSIKQGAFWYGVDKKKVQAISANYTIAGVEYALDPSNDEPVENLQQININFPTLDDVELAENYLNAITLTNLSVGAEEEINAEYVLAGAIRNTFSTNPGTTFTLTFKAFGEEDSAPIIDPGKYVLDIKAGAFVYGRPVPGDAGPDDELPETPDSELNKVQAITAVYTISGVEYALTPASGVAKDLSTITLNLPTVSDVEFVDKFVNSILLENLTTGEVYTFVGAVPNTFSTLPGTTLDLKFVPEGEEDVVPIVQPGNYKLTIQRGAIVYNGGENMVQSIVALYTIPGISFSLNPTTGSYVDEIETVELAFPTVKGVEEVENYTNSMLLTNVTTGAIYNVSAVRNTRAEEGTAFTLHFIKEGQEEATVITEPGEYELIIKEGAFAYANESEDAELEGESIKVQEITATYKIAGVAYVFAPESGSVVEDLSSVTITFPEYKGINLQEEKYVNGIVLTNVTTGEEYMLAGAILDTRNEAGSSYIMHFTSELAGDVTPITQPGEYVLNIQDGVFYYGDDVETAEKLPAMSAQYVIAGTPVLLTPASGAQVEELSEVYINFLTEEEVSYEGIKDPRAIILENTTTGEVYTLAGDPVQIGRTENDGITFQIRFVAEGEDDAAVITTAGTYVLTINEGAFLIGEEKSVAIEATYVIDGTTGVSEVLGEEASEYNVYTVNGVQVLKNADKNAVNALPAGLYIINGKKVIVK